MARAEATDWITKYLLTEFSSIGAQGMATRYGVGIRNVFHRRRRAEEALGRSISVPAHLARDKAPRPSVRQTF